MLERRWRILIGDDAYRLDQAVRAAPEAAYAENADGLFGALAKPVEGWAAEGALRPEEAPAGEVGAEADAAAEVGEGAAHRAAVDAAAKARL
eukprot:SAG22_NODE_8143_length_680_cov_0.578313_2_plen_92_part_00